MSWLVELRAERGVCSASAREALETAGGDLDTVEVQVSVIEEAVAPQVLWEVRDSFHGLFTLE